MSNKILKNWKAYKLESFSIINPSVKLITGNKYPFVAMESVEPNKRYLNNIPLKKFKGSGAKFKARDTIFARITPCLQNGKIAQFNLLNGKVGFGSTEYIVFRDIKSMSDPNYLYYLLQTYEIRKHAESSMAGASGRQRTDLNYVKQIKFLAPPIKTQKKIASILSTYDELIENNRKRIEILEEMAQLLYREWFVEFRFPNHKKTKFINSSLGKIPKKWTVSKIENAFKFTGGGTPSKKNKQYWTGGLINWYTPSDITSHKKGIFFTKSYLQCTKDGLNHSSAKLFPAYSIMMTSRATIGAIGICTTPACTNQGFITCMPNENFPLAYLYYWLKSNKSYFTTLSSGSTFPELIKGTFKKIKIIKPKKQILKKFENIVSPIFQTMELIQNQTIILEQIKNLLLPKLMSGEIKV